MKKNNNEKEKTKQSVKEVFGNNFFLLKLMFTASPTYIIFMAFDAVRGPLSIFFEHTVGISSHFDLGGMYRAWHGLYGNCGGLSR